MPMRSVFSTAHGTESAKHATIVEVIDDGVSGWGECPALEHPTYTEEYADGAFAVLATQLAPAALEGPHWRDAVTGNPMAKAGLELALLDHRLRSDGKSLVAHLEEVTASRALSAVPAGISLGITRDLDELVSRVTRAVAEGYQRVRLKIDRDWDYQPLAAIRSRFPTLPLQVDANGSYRLDDLGALQRLEEFGLLMIEQPLPADDLRGHCLLSRRLAIPLCLDEPITGAEAASAAIAMGACSIVNIKVARLGGLGETLATLGVCRSTGAGAWCGGMLDTGIGRAVNLAVAALDGFTTPGDIAATDRYFDRDLITTRFHVESGAITVPHGSGIGVEIDRDALEAFTTHRVVLRR